MLVQGTTDFIGHAVALQPNDDYLTQACEPMNAKCQLYLNKLWSRRERADFVRVLTFNAPAMSVAIQTASSLFVSTCNAQRRPARCVVWNSSLLRCSWCSAPNASVARKYFLLFHATGVSVSPHRVFDLCISVDVSKDVVVSFSGRSEFIFDRAERRLWNIDSDSPCPVWL